MSDEQKSDDLMKIASDTGFAMSSLQPAIGASAPTAQMSQQDAGGMAQLRGLVLGPVADEMETKISQISKRLDGSMLELDRRTADRVSALETRISDQMEVIGTEVMELKEQQACVLQDVKQELESCMTSLSQKMDALSGRLNQERQDEMQTMRTEFEQLGSSITDRLNCESDVLRSELVDRDALCEALSDLALRISSGSEMIADAAAEEQP